MKFEILKGSEKDFEGAPNWALQVFQNKSCVVKIWFVEKNAEGCRWVNHCASMQGVIGKDLIHSPNVLIAERPPFPEPQPDAESWIEWQGGEPPIKNQSMILDVKYRDGTINNNKYDWTGNVFWQHSGHSSDIIAYRLSQLEKAGESAAPTWNGEGLPPVGCKCEVDIEGWVECEVIAHFKQRSEMVAVFTIEHPDGSKKLDAYVASTFRPLPSPEAIEREKAIAEMWEAVHKDEFDKSVVESLYDAGYRKVGDLS